MRKKNLINSSKMQRKTAYRTFLNDLHMTNKQTGKRGGICSKSTLLTGFPFI